MTARRQWVAVGALLCVTGWGGAALAQDFTYNPPGALFPGSGDGRVDYTTWVPGIRFPIEVGPAYANSQVWGHGGSNGPGGSQCDAENYAYPWWDNFCETRTWEMPLCPAGVGHQGQDIRPSTCADDTHWTVATVDGTITSIGTYSVYLTAADGTIHRYLHQEPSSLVVSVGDNLQRGDRIGRVSNAFGTSSTTIHLHFDLFMNVEDIGPAYVPTYFTLIEGYEALLGQQGTTCGEAGLEGAIIDDGDPCFVLHGPASTWRYVDSAGYDGDLHWSYAWENAASNWAEWLFTVAWPGTWELEVYVTPAYSQAEDLRYSVRDQEGEHELRVDQSAGDGWLSLGTYSFEAGGAYNVAVYDGPGEALSLQHQFVADALRITPVDVVGPEEPAPDEPPDMGGPDLDAGSDGAEEPDLGAPDLTETGDAEAEPDLSGEVAPDQGDDGSAPPDVTEVNVNSGCGCSLAEPAGPASTWAWLLGMLWLTHRARRRQAKRPS